MKIWRGIDRILIVEQMVWLTVMITVVSLGNLEDKGVMSVFVTQTTGGKYPKCNQRHLMT